ncbi:EndoU domain-containing protein [Niveispirillum fermenti]|uniref:EndoU domain-containing protein n=1 Tax=Niveispirillum fermenti TaxID=1233113 RepID=UPI003A87030D
MLALAASCGAAFPALADGPDCRDADFRWSRTEPAINMRHVLCGEIKGNGDVVGLHARAIAGTAPVKAIRPEGGAPDGTYGARVEFSNGKTKFSTFYPDHCTAADIEKSILHAVRNSFGAARPWGRLGCAAPDGTTPGYCRGPQGQRLVIRFGELKDGRINTAFPLTGETCP